jgi:N-6 DNA Methylase
MRTRARDLFATVRSEGGILPPDLLERIAAGDGGVEGLSPGSYHLAANERLGEATNRSWNRLLGAWAAFDEARAGLRADDPGTTLTRERWLLILFQELGYGRLQGAGAVDVDGKRYAVSHSWGASPIHLVGCRVELDRRTAGVAGAAASSPHSMVQELLNRSDEYLWAFVSNGLGLRVLRDNVALTRQSFLEFDLEAMMVGEVYSDFVLLWLVCHQSRVEGERPEDCWLERWSRTAAERGVRALDQLRDGVAQAIEALGRGFLAHPGSGALRDRLRSGALDPQDYYRQLLRLVYRLLFLFAAEDRELLLDPRASREARGRYARFYSTGRLRELAGRRRGSKHGDLYEGLRVVSELLAEQGCAPLGLPVLGSFLWSPEAVEALDGASLSNDALLDAVRALAYAEDRGVRRPVDFKNLGAEELGSVYESLLELHPALNLDAANFSLGTASGHERKTTGSYYTPTSLITELLNSALDPVLDEAARGDDPEQAIRDLKVCDPACGSGHFLIAAAHRIAKRLAAVRTRDDEPAPEALRTALRDVIASCIYGVDVNPMAVELCKVALWMEALAPGKPLSFLDHRIACGNALLGTTPALITAGIPASAFKPLLGDDKDTVAELRKRNKAEPRWQTLLDTDEALPLGERLGEALERLGKQDADSLDAVQAQERRFDDLTQSDDYSQAKLLADAWCAAFVAPKRPGSPTLTQATLNRIAGGTALADGDQAAIDALADEYRFLHWHIAFPDVFRIDDTGRDPTTGWAGGFDAVIGNPPWERVKLQEKEFFAQLRPDIAGARNAAARKRMIDALREEAPALHKAFLAAGRRSEGASHLVRNSGRYPLCGRGDLNTYSIFAETNRMLVGPTRRVGCIVPSGIATDDTTKAFFQDLMESRSLVSLYDFENKGIFPGVHRSYKFCLLTMAGRDRPATEGAEFVFFGHATTDLADPERRFTLSAEDIELLNPNTRTCPIFRTGRDAELTKQIYRHVPVLVREGDPHGNPWGVTFMRMFDMANDSHLFRTREELEDAGWHLNGNVFRRGEERYLPLYEPKMTDLWDHHRAHVVISETAVVRQGQPELIEEGRRGDPLAAAMPRYWVDQDQVDRRLGAFASERWQLGWKDVTSSTNARTLVAVALPKAGAGHKFQLVLSAKPARLRAALLANLCSFALDFVARQKLGGVSLTYFVMRQLPVLSPQAMRQPAPWAHGTSVCSWLTTRVLELVYTAHDMEGFSEELAVLRFRLPGMGAGDERSVQRLMRHSSISTDSPTTSRGQYSTHSRSSVGRTKPSLASTARGG